MRKEREREGGEEKKKTGEENERNKEKRERESLRVYMPLIC